jgi:cytochrome oxidase assembly protein ShyY1
VAQHDFSRQPAILYWFDLANPYAEDEDAAPKKRAFYALATRVQDKLAKEENATTFPLAPSAEQVGDFPVPPAMHVGYAVTWYGLSLAGVYMMRMLLTRGR